MAHPSLLRILERARTLGLTGPGDPATHLGQASALAAIVEEPPTRFLDLGSGAGLPGLPLLVTWPEATAVLLDAGTGRSGFLRSAIGELDLTGRAAVAEGRAEVLARDPDLRGVFDLVVARGFGPPAVTAECAVGFLRVGGVLAVTDPPDPEEGRWDAEGLELLGLEYLGARREEGFGFSLARAARPVAEKWPRRAPAKRPLWGGST